MRKRNAALLAGAFGAGFLLAGCGSQAPPLTLAPSVDTARYAGRWYIIANIPYVAEKGKVGSYFDISFPTADRVVDTYSARARTFDQPLTSFTLNGYIVPGTNNARWRESPFWPLYLSYLILYVDPDYRHALIGYPGRGYGWVLAREPLMDDATYQALLARFGGLGYDTAQFRRVPQSPDQIGQPGFAAQ